MVPNWCCIVANRMRRLFGSGGFSREMLFRVNTCTVNVTSEVACVLLKGVTIQTSYSLTSCASLRSFSIFFNTERCFSSYWDGALDGDIMTDLNRMLLDVAEPLRAT